MATTKKRAGENGANEGSKGEAKRPRLAKAGSSSSAGGRTIKSQERPRMKASHSSAKVISRSRKAPAAPPKRRAIAAPAEKSGPPSGRKTALAAPKRERPVKREQSPEPSSQAREMAVSIAIAGLDKKALAIEILDVTGKVDYADFLVVMTGRSDRHVHAIATGIEEALVRKNKVKPMSVEGLATATWVLIDFGEVVVHVFQEDARKLYDIEGLWIDAGRVPLPESEQKAAAQIDSTEGPAV